ncbi:MAG: NAD(P)/FAD-dependent oxidoreductase [Bacteroidota bacterium]
MYSMSFWERESVFNGIDVFIAGSGIVGLCSAIAMKKIQPAARIVVGDRGFLPYGASTRNAGFACFGSISELLDDLSRESENEVAKRVERRWKGLQKLRALLGDEAIGFENNGGYELFTSNDQLILDQCLETLPRMNRMMEEITGKKEIYSLQNENIGTFGFKQVKSLIANSEEGQIHTGNMMVALMRKATAEGVIILNGIEIESLEDHVNHTEIVCNNGLRIHAKKTLLATNGFAKNLIPELEVEPARAQVLITSPIEKLSFKGIFHYDLGYYYFRNIGNRILFGGGRNMDFETEHTTTFGLTDIIQNRLDELLKTVIIPNTPYEVEMRWSGIMGMGGSKSPIIKKTGHNTYCAVRMGGMGIAIGALVGEETARMMDDGRWTMDDGRWTIYDLP